jgi:hypothetical protein
VYWNLGSKHKYNWGERGELISESFGVKNDDCTNNSNITAIGSPYTSILLGEIHSNITAIGSPYTSVLLGEIHFHTTVEVPSRYTLVLAMYIS